MRAIAGILFDKGFEIAMHGYTHVYDSDDSKKKDYFGLNFFPKPFSI